MSQGHRASIAQESALLLNMPSAVGSVMETFRLHLHYILLAAGCSVCVATPCTEKQTVSTLHCVAMCVSERLWQKGRQQGTALAAPHCRNLSLSLLPPPARVFLGGRERLLQWGDYGHYMATIAW